MANITIIKGDMFKSAAEFYCDAVNCVGPHAAGIAAEFERRAPYYSEVYKARAGELYVHPRMPPVIWYDDVLKKTCIAVPTMLLPGQRSTNLFLMLSLRSLAAALPPNASVAMPALGCGIGGLWFSNLIGLVTDAFRVRPDVSIELYEPL